MLYYLITYDQPDEPAWLSYKGHFKMPLTWLTWKAPLPWSNCLSFECHDVMIFLIESITNRTVSKHFIPQEKPWPNGKLYWLTSARVCDAFERDNSHSRNLRTSQTNVQWQETGSGKSLSVVTLLSFFVKSTEDWHYIWSYQNALELHRDNQPGNHKVKKHMKYL